MRLLLSGLVCLAVIVLWYSRFDELFYHTVASSNVVELGDARHFDKIKHSIKPNTYVHVTGVLGNKAATISGIRAGSFRCGRHQVRHLLGSKIYLEYSESKYHNKWSPFTEVSVKGRLNKFGPNSDLKQVRKFFSKHYNHHVADDAIIVVVDEIPRSENKYLLLFMFSLFLVGVSFYSAIRTIIY